MIQIRKEGVEMSSNKSKEKKNVLSRHLRQNRRVPIFVVARTARRVSRNVKARNWRTSKLKIKQK